MPRFASPAAHLKRVEQRQLEIRLVLAEHIALEASTDEENARKLLSGHRSTAELRRRGHPFARRHLGQGKGRFIPTAKLPINRQSGRLIRGLKMVSRGSIGRFVGDGTVTKRVEFHGVPYSKFVLRKGGTKFMVDRGFWDAIERERKRRASRTQVHARIRRINST